MVARVVRGPLAVLLAAALSMGACGDDDRKTQAPSTTGVHDDHADEGSEESDGHDHGDAEDALTAMAACGKPIAEKLDPESGRHLLPSSPEPTYLTDPPTSGAHRTGKHPTGVLPDPIPRPVQVAMLEAGQVIIQHKDVDKAGFDRLAALATESVTVAPNPSLPGAVVATAYQVKLVCKQIDEDALRAFISTYLKPEEPH